MWPLRIVIMERFRMEIANIVLFRFTIELSIQAQYWVPISRHQYIYESQGTYKLLEVSLIWV